MERVESAGFQIERIECYGFPLANLTEWVGNFFYTRMLARRTTDSREAATADSGVDRRHYVRLGGLIDSFFGSALLRVAFAMQYLTRNTDWGSGYLLLARKA